MSVTVRDLGRRVIPRLVSLIVSCAAAGPTQPICESSHAARPLGRTSSSSSGATASVPVSGQPSIVFILTDDLDTASMASLPRLQSLLADHGATFTHFFVTDSLCCPSRSSILCGEYNHNHRVFTNWPPNGGYPRFLELGHERATIGTWLQAAGYRTVLMGKYLNGYPHPAQPTHVPPGWNEWYVPADGYPYGEFDYTLNENGRLVVRHHESADYLTDVLASKAAAFIREAGTDPRPFFMYVAPYAPHTPATPAPRYKDALPGVTAPRPPSFDEADLTDKPAWLKHHRRLTREEIDRIDDLNRRRLQSMLAVEDLVATVLDALAAEGRLDSTYLFLASDNGYHLGEHRLMPGKQTSYEEDIRVPLLVRGPGVPAGSTIDSIAGNIDLAPTFLDLAGAPIPDAIDGRSLAPLLSGTPPAPGSWRGAYLLEHTERGARAGPGRGEEESAPVRDESGWNTPPGTLEPPDLMQSQDLDKKGSRADRESHGKRDEPSVPNFEGIRTDRMVYVEYATGERELYDLAADPYELQNLAAAAGPALLGSLSAWLSALRQCQGASCRSADVQPPSVSRRRSPSLRASSCSAGRAARRGVSRS